jgi:hypothetical protein
MTTTKPKPFKSKPRKAELDKLWRDVIRLRDGGKCRVCGKTEYLQAAHIHSRSKLSTRWALLNGVALCYYHHHRWAHQHPVDFVEWCKEQLGQDQYAALWQDANSPVLFTPDVFRYTKAYLCDALLLHGGELP